MKNRLFTELQITNFCRAFLVQKYDDPVAIAHFHKTVWDLVAQGHRRIAIAAPRKHAKSTAFTHALTLFLFCFRIKKYGIIVSDTEKQASSFLGDIKTELLENEELRQVFGIKHFLKDAITEVIVEFEDGARFKIEAKGAEQKVRGSKWDNLRPDYIIVDDIENDELVSSDERRNKLQDWFLKALLPSLAKKKGTLIMVGTILHMDSMLMRRMSDRNWTHILYKAHKGFDDFSEILWPENWSEQDLRLERQEYIDAGHPEAYAAEFLNDPISHSEAYFKKTDFKETTDEMRVLPTTNYAAVDLAISDADKAAYTVIVIGGLDQYKRLLIKQVIRFRGDGNEIINTMFEVQRLYNIDIWKVEKGQILLTLMGEIQDRMHERGIYLNIVPGVPTKDKRSRARAIQARMRAGGVYFDKGAEWYPIFEEELLQFPKGLFKDQVDAIAWLGIAISELHEGPTSEEVEDDEYMERLQEFNPEPIGRSEHTGY